MPINNTYDRNRKRLRNLPAVGFAANQRVLERLSHGCILSEYTLRAIERPLTTGRQRARPALRRPARQSLLHALSCIPATSARMHPLIERTLASFRYHVTNFGLRVAQLYIRV